MDVLRNYKLECPEISVDILWSYELKDGSSVKWHVRIAGSFEANLGAFDDLEDAKRAAIELAKGRVAKMALLPSGLSASLDSPRWITQNEETQCPEPKAPSDGF